MTASNTLACATFLGVFNGMSCSLERARGRDDAGNSLVAGIVAGTVIGLQHQKTPSAVAGVALGAGCLTSMLHLIRGTAIAASSKP